MSMFDDLKAKAQEAMEQNPDKVEEFSDMGIDKAGDAIDRLTGGKYGEQVDSAQEKADDAIGE